MAWLMVVSWLSLFEIQAGVSSALKRSTLPDDGKFPR